MNARITPPPADYRTYLFTIRRPDGRTQEVRVGGRDETHARDRFSHMDESVCPIVKVEAK